MEQIPQGLSEAEMEHGEVRPQEYGAPKSWMDILVEGAEEIPEDARRILEKKISREGLVPSEQAILSAAVDRFWREKFGVPFAYRNGGGGKMQKKEKPKTGKVNAVEHAGASREAYGVYKEFSENFEDYVVYEDNDILVINKPPGISTQGKSPQEPFSIASFIGSVRPGTNIVHRIDKETSGILILGKSSEIRSSLAKNWKNAEKEKWYVAISSGAYESKVVGSILPLEEKGAGARVSMQEPAKTSSTYFNKLMDFEKNGRPFSLLRVRIFSGRKHQIRVSLKHLGFPIVGDKLYNKQSRASGESARHLLHAYKLTLAHPRTGEIMDFTAPLPEDMREFLGSYPGDALEQGFLAKENKRFFGNNRP